MAAKYHVAILGKSSPRWSGVEPVLFTRLDELGVGRDQIVIVDEASIGSADPKAPLVAIFFGYDGASDHAHSALAKLIKNSNTIIPCVPELRRATSMLPESIRPVNAFAFDGSGASIERLASIILENLRLLRVERRLFISYKRTEAQSIAIQLYEALDEKGFDVFLDTRSVPFAANFQDVLWHRMADSDVVVLLDTPGFRGGFWTSQELSKANATNIQILHLLWPDVLDDKSSAFSEFVQLDATHFVGPDHIGPTARFLPQTIENITTKVESLRARALAFRHRSLVDAFCDRAREEHATNIAVQPERFISVELSTGALVAVVPTIGVPRADRCQELEIAIRNAGAATSSVWLLYDERGILRTWLDHLAWLNSHLPVKSVQVSKCTDQLRGGPA